MKIVLLIFCVFCSLTLMAQQLCPVQNFSKISDVNGNLSDYDNLREVKYIGDLNNDNVSDIAVGAPYDDDGGPDRGAVWILFLNLDGTVMSGQKISDISGNFDYPLIDGDYFGYSIGTIGDLDGDSIPDLAVGSWADDESGTNSGALWILFLNANGTVKNWQKINMQHGGFTGYYTTNSHFGICIDNLGDFDHDGVTDLAVGSSMQSNNGLTNVGALWILLMNTNGTVKGHYKITSGSGNFTGTLNANDRFGRGVANLGDLDGDGVTDIGVGAIYDDQSAADAGAVWILFLNSNGTVKSHTKICNNSSGFPAYLNATDYFGMILSSGVDLTGDGKYELAVASHAMDWGGSNRGAIWILSLNSNGTVNDEWLLCSGSSGFTGQLDNEDGFGSGLSFMPVSGSLQRFNISVGAGGDDDGGTNRGAVYNIHIDMLSSVSMTNHSASFITYPNPFNDNLYILLPSDIGNEAIIVITDISGRNVLSKTIELPSFSPLLLNVHDLHPGVYVMQVYIDGVHCGTKKIIRY